MAVSKYCHLILLLPVDTTSAVMSIIRYIAFICVYQLAVNGLQAQSIQPVELQTPITLFTDPKQFEDGKKDRTLLNQISDLISATPVGEEITVCVFKFELEDLAQELVQAQERGVKVRVILNKGDTSKETNKEVKDFLQLELPDFHWIENTISNKGIIHNKFILFSSIESTDGPIRHVILQTSSNFQKKGAKKLQDMLIVSSAELYYCFLDFWFEIKVLGRADRLENFNYFSCSDQNGHKAYFFPKRKNEKSHGADNVLKALKDIKHPEQTEIRFAHGKWGQNREDLAEELQQLKEKGALVEVVTNRDVDKDIRKDLKNLDQGIYYLDDSYKLHTKFFLIGEGSKKQVWTGSHNLTERSLRENFEVLLKVDDRRVYKSYLNYFNKIKALAAP